MRDEMNDELIDRVAETLREPVRVSPAVDARVMAAVRAIAAGAPSPAAPEGDLLVGAPATPRELSLVGGGVPRARRRGALGWLTSPRELRVSPLAGLAVAAGLAAVVVTTASVARDAGADAVRAEIAAAQPAPVEGGAAGTFVSGPAESAPVGAMRVVSFVFAAPGAQKVSLAADFNDWAPDALPLVQSAAGIWSVAVPLAPGRYSYSFVVDGRTWEADPAAAPAVDDYGIPSSTLVVGAR